MSELIAKLWRRIIPERGHDHVPKAPDVQTSRLSSVRSGNDRLFNREISDLLFIQRVTEESQNENHPLLERTRFLSIASNVLDQFYTVRVAKLRRSTERRDGYTTPDGLTAMQQLMTVLENANQLSLAQQTTWHELRSRFAQHDVYTVEAADLDDQDHIWLGNYFRSRYLHVLTPYTLDEEHPFPFIPSGGLCAILELDGDFVLLPLPANLPRYIRIPGDTHRFIAAETMIECFWRELIPGEQLSSFGIFQILRDNDLAKEEMNDDLRAIIETGLRTRHKANVIKLKVSASMSESAIRFVTMHLGLLTSGEIHSLENRNDSVSTSDLIFRADLVGLADIVGLVDQLSHHFSELLFPPHTPRDSKPFTQHDDCFSAISAGDILVHWPYDSYESVASFVSQAAEDPDVVAIRQTLYRTSDDSEIVKSLIDAARNGKTVLAVIELEARDDEAANVKLAKRMESAGVQIVYGIIGLKIHCKATLVVRMENDSATTYAHLGTGNYHAANARIYTDISFFTKDPVIGNDMHKMFSYITSERSSKTEKLMLAPVSMRETLYNLIDSEIEFAVSGAPAYICIKVNSLTDTGIVEKLYEASEAGVNIDLIVRRHCTLRPGVPGMSSHIQVKSIVGRFLEHSRIYMFGGGAPVSYESALLYFGSADLMERNLDERAELLVPVEDRSVRRTIIDGILHANIKDSTQSWILDADNKYHRHTDERGFSAQGFLMSEADPHTLGPFEPSEATDDRASEIAS